MVSFLDNSGCAMYPPETRVCGPGGLQCILGNESVSAVCECEEGWTNIGDFALSPSGPCDMYILAVQALWGIMGVSNFLNVLLSIWFLWRKLEGSGSLSDLREKLDGASQAVLCFGLDGLWFTIAGALRAGDPLRYIVGGELFVSFAYSLGVAFFWVGVLVYFSNIITTAYKNLSVKSNEDKARSSATLKSMRKIIPGFYAFMALVAILPFLMAIVNASYKGTSSVGRYDQVIAGIHFVGAAIMELSIGVFWIPRWLNSIIEDCETIIDVNVKMKVSDERTERLRNTINKFKVFKKEACKQAGITGVLSILFGCWEYLTHKSSYIMPFNVASAAWLCMLLTWSLSNFSSKVQKDTADDITSQKSSGLKLNKVQVSAQSPKAANSTTGPQETELHHDLSASTPDV